MARLPLSAAARLFAAGLLLAPASAALAQAIPAAAPGAVPLAPALAPTLDPPQPIGSYANGCIQGARALAPEGPGYQAVNLSRQRTFGHPVLLDYVTTLAARARTDGLGRLAVGDLSKPRGGRMESGHASHQIGLDVDLWFDLDRPDLPRPARERLDFPSMVDGATQRVDPQRFGPRQRQLLRLAAGDPRVARIFVNPAIKLALCESETGDRSWLRTIRPWFGHDSHFHVRLACPAGAASCVSQDPAPPGDGCGAELLSWFEPPKDTPRERTKPPAPPAACVALFAR